MTEYNLHNLFGHQHSEATYNYLTSNTDYPNKAERPFIISRSTYTGSGRFTGQFARTEPTWESLKNSVAQLFTMQASGIPFSGLDICGTTGEPSDELCGRWMQLGAFYPLARNYYENSTESPIEKGHELYNLENEKRIAASSAL